MSGWMCGMDGYGVDGRLYVSRYVQGVEVYLDSVMGCRDMKHLWRWK